VTVRVLRLVAYLVAAILAFSVTLVASGAPPRGPVVSEIAAGVGRHACAIVGNFDGAVCWGANGSGQLGNGSRSSAAKPTPVKVAGLAFGVKTISVGYAHSCALTRHGGVKCWGWNASGQLGNGSRKNSRVPVDVRGLTGGVSAIAAGFEYTCAVTRGTRRVVKCWGSDVQGQLGRRFVNRNFSTKPVVVRGFGHGVEALSAGFGQTCALTVVGGVECWGENPWGLGDGTHTLSYKPVGVAGLTNGVKAIAVAFGHACAVTFKGGVKCWGSNTRGELGNNSEGRSATPVDVVGLASGVKAITAGGNGESPDLTDDFTCALTSGGGAKCWGDNLSGELGNGSQRASRVPVDVVGLASGVKAIAAGAEYTCASMNRGGVKCWGDNVQGQLGNGSKEGLSLTPVDALVPDLQTCTIDYCVPPDWNAHPGKDLPVVIQKDKLLNRDEPLNVIFSAASNVKIDPIVDALAHESGEPWREVPPGKFSLRPNWGCVSVESADVNGTGQVRQQSQLRVGAGPRRSPCVTGAVVRALNGNENHARLWAQNVPPSGKKAWFATVSFETLCIVRAGPTHLTYKDILGNLILLNPHVTGTLWHCINGGPGSFGKDGYDMGARVLVKNLCTAAKRRGWYASFRKDPRPAGVGQNGVRYSGHVYVLRVDSKPPQPAPSGVTRCGA
jgi:alpha-tubulin suppressor-like RCC1 family protein